MDDLSRQPRRALILVEGPSDRIALETLAARRGRDLAAEGVEVMSIGGAQAIARALRGVSGIRIAGLYDVAEERAVLRGLERAGVDVTVYAGDEISRKGDGGPTCLTRPLLRG